MPLDIRDHPTWVPTVHTLKTVADLREFYEKELAPERSAKNQWLPDLNQDGSNDLRDLAELKERLYRIQDTDGDGIADTSKIMIEGFNADPTYDIAGGLLYNGGDLLIGSAPGVWRLKDDNGDGTIDRQIVISEGYSIHPAFGGHGISGLTMGPDGRIYWEVGDIGLDVTDKSGKRWSYPNQGAVMRSEPDGSNFEVFATGIRNLQEFSFDEYGNLISVDNDGDHQGETERVVYIPNGSDSGWRSNWQYGKYTDAKNNRYNVWMDESMFKPRFAGQAAHIVPPVAAYHSGPSGMVYNPGTALTDEWKNYFFVSSFPGAAAGARIYGFKLKEDGAGFALEDDKVVLRGILTVGLKFGPDGALYLADWITGWDSKNKGRIWKLDSPAAAASPMRTEVRTLIAAKFDARSVRGSVDAAAARRHAHPSEGAVRARPARRRAVARSPRPRTRRTSWRAFTVSGASRSSRERRRTARSTPRSSRRFLTDSDAEIRAQAAKMIGDLRYAPAASNLVPLLADTAPRGAVLRGRGARPDRLQAGGGADRRDARRQRRQGRLPASRRQPGALANRRRRRARRALVEPVPRRAHRRHRRAAPPAQSRGRAIRHRQRRRRSSSRRHARSMTTGRSRRRCRRWRGSSSDKRSVSEPLLRRAISANLKVGSAEALARVAAFAA